MKPGLLRRARDSRYDRGRNDARILRFEGCVGLGDLGLLEKILENVLLTSAVRSSSCSLTAVASSRLVCPVA